MTMRIFDRALRSSVLVLTFALIGLPAAHADAADPEPPFVICHQPNALCATASCFVYDGVAYCQCDIERGKSLSLQLDYTTPTGKTRNACDVGREGLTNGFLISTYSLPSGSDTASYVCPGTDNAGGGVPAPVAYAQCDGGLCFRSTVGQHFPGFEERLARDQIICSCPISTAATPESTNELGYEVAGPYAPNAPDGQKCDPAGCAKCSVPSPTGNGAIIKVGGPTGASEFTTLRLYGPPLPNINRGPCECTQGTVGASSCTLAPGAP
jgi:hypothetical protein